MDNPKKHISWLEFSLLVDPDQEEEIREILSSILPAGLVSERIYSGVFPDELNNVKVPVRLFGYLPDDDNLNKIKEDINRVLGRLPGGTSIPEPEYRPVENLNWATAWQEHYHPICLGKNLLILPSWLKNPHPDRIVLTIDPGMAFGSGTHPTTQLCLELLEEYQETASLDTVIDIGCGSGILSIAAVKFGANFVLGLDLDQDAINASRENARRNKVDVQSQFIKGSVETVLQGELKVKQAGLVLVNIILPVLNNLFEVGLADLVESGGSLILSGILEHQLTGIKQQLSERGFLVHKQLQSGDWIALWAKKFP
jgi:ribosomal protein L11 methyltransferase